MVVLGRWLQNLAISVIFFPDPVLRINISVYGFLDLTPVLSMVNMEQSVTSTVG